MSKFSRYRNRGGYGGDLPEGIAVEVITDLYSFTIYTNKMQALNMDTALMVDIDAVDLVFDETYKYIVELWSTDRDSIDHVETSVKMWATKGTYIEASGPAILTMVDGTFLIEFSQEYI